MSLNNAAFLARLEKATLELKNQTSNYDKLLGDLIATLTQVETTLNKDEKNFLESLRIDQNEIETRRQRNALIIAGCADQPAGTPAIIDNSNLPIALARGYAQPDYHKAYR